MTTTTTTTKTAAPSPSGDQKTPSRLSFVLARVKGDGWGDVMFVPLVLGALVLYLSFSTEFFLTSLNLTNLLTQAAVLAVVSFGLTFVILSGELDLSVGAGVALASVVGAMVMRDNGGSILLGLIATLGIGLLIGLVNGLIVTKLEVPSFIATLGMMTIAGGVALALTNGAVVGGVPVGLGNLVTESFLGVRWVLWLVLAVFAALFFVQAQTGFGVRVFAVGGNREAARLSAVPVDRVRLYCFLLTGLCVGIGAFILLARVQSGQPNSGGLLSLTAIAAIVVGGNNLLGGRGSISRTFWGVLLIAVLTNGLQLKGIDDSVQQIVIGVVFIAAASADFVRRISRRRRLRLDTKDVSPADPAASP